MEQHGELSFNCAESVLLCVNKQLPIPDFGVPCMRIASVLGGGVAGAGEICGAVSGAILTLGLHFGTNGNEVLDEFKDKRTSARELIRNYLKKFENAWGSLRCEKLIAMDKGELSPKGDMRHNDQEIRNRCDEYVEWSCKTMIDILHHR